MAIDIKNLNHAQLSELIKRAEARQMELKKGNADKVRAKIAVLAEGLDLDDVFGGRGKKRRSSRRMVAPKYRNLAAPSREWSGRGRQPRWSAAAINAGKREKNFDQIGRFIVDPIT